MIAQRKRTLLYESTKKTDFVDEITKIMDFIAWQHKQNGFYCMKSQRKWTLLHDSTKKTGFVVWKHKFYMGAKLCIN